MDEIDRTLERALAAPFPIRDIEWRIQSSWGKGSGIGATCLVYVTNRAIMHRLDECVGIHGWKNEVPVPGPCGGLMQGISLRVGDEWITKWDGAENTTKSPVKGGLSDSMKRSAVLIGIGRYLYRAPDGFARISKIGQYYAKTPKKHGEEKFNWDPPKNMMDFVMNEYDPKHEAAKPPEKAVQQNSADSVSRILNDFIGEMEHCSTAEMRDISRRILDSGLDGNSLQILRDAKQIRLAQIDIDNDN